MVIYFIVCFALIVLAMMQSKEDAGLSSTITGSSSNNFFEKKSIINEYLLSLQPGLLQGYALKQTVS